METRKRKQALIAAAVTQQQEQGQQQQQLQQQVQKPSPFSSPSKRTRDYQRKATLHGDEEEYEIEDSIEFLYRPHNISILLIAIAALIYIALFIIKEDHITNTKIGIVCSIGSLVLIGLLQFKDGPFIRPHPAFWRVVMALAVAYQMALIILLFQSKSNAREWFKYIDPSLGVPLPEKNYGDNCELTISNIWDQLDIFIWAHTIGWIAKALILRDYWLCWVISILFEIMEYSLAHQLPNFGECWWDHWILDVLLTNWLGIYIGMKICEYFEMKQYSFRGIGELVTVKGKLQRGMQQFTPHAWTKFEWGVSSSFTRFMSILGLIVLEIICELNAFYLKYLLWIPVESKINLWRLIYFFFLCLPAAREGYEYISNPNCKRLGMFAWLATANILTELIIIVKFSVGEFLVPFPTEVLVFWTIFLLWLAGSTFFRYYKK